MTQVPIAERLFTWPSDAPELIGCACTACDFAAFPFQTHCAACGEATEETLLGREGTLYTWTTQQFQPVAPPFEGPLADGFESFGIGWVDLGRGVMVEARLTEGDPARLTFDMRVELVIVPFAERDGDEVVTFAFAPTGN